MGDSIIASDKLRSYVERIERLEEEKTALSADVKEVYAELKSDGFDAKIVRKVIRLRKMDRAEFQEQEALIDIYMSALGMLADTPLGQSAVRRATSMEARPQ
jgi:uncharacterized protein (UPF0335 family)